MQKVIYSLLFISILANLFLGYKLYIHKPNSAESFEKIDSLELELISYKKVRDSIKEVIDTVYIEINNNEKKYEETYNTIINYSSDEDYKFFTEYLEWYNNRRTTETN